jgi:hypothetical protein
MVVRDDTLEAGRGEGRKGAIRIVSVYCIR